MQFRLAYDNYLKYISNHLKVSSFMDKIKIFEKFILPTFKNAQIEELTKEQLKQWQNTLEHYGYKYKSKIRGYLYNFLDFCEYEWEIPNAMKKVRNFARNKYASKSSYNVWTLKEFNRFIQFISSAEDKAIFNILYGCQLRKGELCGLTWNDWIKDKNYLNINKTFSRITNVNSALKSVEHKAIKVYNLGKVAYILNEPKSVNSIRRVAVPPKCKDCLQQLYDLKKQQIGFNNNYYIFGNYGDFLRYSTLNNRFLAYMKKSRLKKIRLHDLRHSGVSLLINTYKADIGTNSLHLAYIIAERLGDTVEQVLRTYGHLFASEQEKLANAIEL